MVRGPKKAKAKEGCTHLRKVAIRSRFPVIIVDVSHEDFPALTMKIRGGASREIIDNHVVGMRQARFDGILIEVCDDGVEAVRTEVSRSVGADFGVTGQSRPGYGTSL